MKHPAVDPAEISRLEAELGVGDHSDPDFDREVEQAIAEYERSLKDREWRPGSERIVDLAALKNRVRDKVPWAPEDYEWQPGAVRASSAYSLSGSPNYTVIQSNPYGAHKARVEYGRLFGPVGPIITTR